jgi:hypothetical protein
MQSPRAAFATALASAALAALGGGLAVYSGYDDAPGGVLIGLALIVVAAALGGRAALRRG